MKRKRFLALILAGAMMLQNGLLVSSEEILSIEEPVITDSGTAEETFEYSANEEDAFIEAEEVDIIIDDITEQPDDGILADDAELVTESELYQDVGDLEDGFWNEGSEELAVPNEYASSVASGTCGDNFTWVLDDSGTLAINGSGNLEGSFWEWGIPYAVVEVTNVVINEGVTSIGDYAFAEVVSLASVTLPDSVTYIGKSSFSQCYGLKKIVIPNHTAAIGENAFFECRSMTEVTIPASVTSIGEGSFARCWALESMILDPSNQHYVVQDGVLYNKDKTELILCTSTKKGQFAVPASVKNIFADAFGGCAGLTRIRIPLGVISIGDSAFYGCSSLVSINIPSSVTSIGSYAFSGCSSLISMSIPTSVTSISDGMFSRCTGLTKISIPSSVTNVGSYAFSDCSSLADVYYSGSETEWKAISMGSRNDCLTNATIHYNSTGPDDNQDKIVFEEGSYSCGLNDSVSITATYISDSNNPPDDIIWSSNDKNAVEFSGTSIMGPEITGVENTYWISTMVTGLKGGSFEITLYVGNAYATTGFTVTDLQEQQRLNVKAAFDDNSRTKSLHWTSTGYTEEEITLNITVTAYGENIAVNRIDVELQNLKMFKVKESSSVTNQGSDYYYTVNADESLFKGETVTFQLTLVKKGWTWWKPNDTDSHAGLINITVAGNTSDGSEVSSTLNAMNQLSIDYQNDVKIQKAVDDEEKAAQEAASNAESSAKDAVEEFVDLSDKMVLDPNIKTYIGSNQFEALKLLIYTEISLANISKSYFTSAGLSDKVAERVMEKFIGYKNPPFTIGDKDITIEVAVLGNNNKQYQFQFDCDVTVFYLKGIEFGINGSIKTQMWQVSKANQKLSAISCVDGIINQGDINAFSKGAWNVAQASLQSAYKNVWGSSADKLANGIVDSSIDSIASKAAKYGLEKPVQIILKKYYEKKLGSKFSESIFKLLTYPSKLAIVQCPVDVYVYDSNNNLVGSIIDDQAAIAGDGIALWTEGDNKYIQLFDDSYQIVYKSMGTGTMTINIYDQTFNNINYRNCEFSLVPLSEETEYAQLINGTLLTGTDSYALVSNQGTTITATGDEYLYTDVYPETSTEQPVHSHVWDHGVITKAATCTAAGVITYTCISTNCGATKTEVVAAKGHTWGNWVTTSAATVFAPEQQMRRCSVCQSTETRSTGNKLSPAMSLNASSLKLKKGQSTTALKVSGMANGDSVKSVVSSKTTVLKVVSYNASGSIKLKAQKKTGTAKLTITLASGLSKTISVKVQSGTVKTTKIKVNTKQLTLKKGNTATLSATVTPITSQQKVTYTSSNKKVVTVSSKGVIKAKKAGTAKITVKSGSKKVTVKIKVTK